MLKIEKSITPESASVKVLEIVALGPGKINASTAYDTCSEPLTPFGGLLGLIKFFDLIKFEVAEINVLLGKKKSPSMLGRNALTEWVKRTFFGEKRHMEVPESRSLAPDVGRIRAVVCKSYDVDEQALTLTRRGIANEPRSMSIYFMRQLKGDSLKQIGREFKIAKYSSVSRVVQRMKAMIAKDRKLRKHSVELREELNMSQEQTCPAYNQP